MMWINIIICIFKKSVEIFNEKFTAEIYARNIEKVYEGLIK